MVPKQRHTKSRRNRRRSHQALKAAVVFRCEKCGEMKLAHRVCGRCGYYQGLLVIDVSAKLSKKEKKELEKQKEEQTKVKPLSLEELSKK